MLFVIFQIRGEYIKFYSTGDTIQAGLDIWNPVKLSEASLDVIMSLSEIGISPEQLLCPKGRVYSRLFTKVH